MAAGPASSPRSLVISEPRRPRSPIAFTLANPAVATVLFGATRPAQINENAAALEVLDRLDEQQLARLKSIGATGEQE